MGQPLAYASLIRPESQEEIEHSTVPESPRKQLAARVILSDVPNDLIPQPSNMWQCSCDTDGCWPGCFTIASASVAKYWAAKGFANLWNGDENGTFARLRELFPNLFCYNNFNDDGKPSDSGYDAFDVATGFRTFLAERGYEFTVTPIPNATFEQVVAEIDAGRPIIGAFASSPWGSHAATVIGYDTTDGKQVMIVRPNLWSRLDTELNFGEGYSGFGLVTVVPAGVVTALPIQTQTQAQTQTQTDTLTIEPKIQLPPSYEVTVNDTDAGFTFVGNWVVTDTLGQAGQAYAINSTDPTNFGPQEDTGWVRWTPDLPFDGLWEVMAYMPITDTEDIATHLAMYRVNHAEGMNLQRRSQHDSVEGWASLGSYPFIKGSAGSVYLGNKTGDDVPRQVYADAMRFVWRGPLLVKPEENDMLFLVLAGRRHLIPDPETFGALRLSRGNVRVLSALQMAQYPEAEPIPSIFTSWVGQYFNNETLAFPSSSVRGDGNLNFRWNGAAPEPGMKASDFTVRWSRMFALTEGEYAFTIDAIGGLRLWVDGKLVLDEWGSRGIFVQHQKVIQASAGLHRVEIEYLARDGFAQISLGNLPPNMPIVLDTATPTWSQTPTATLKWADSGDVDNTEAGRKFFVTVWRDDGVDVQSAWRVTSGWITAMEWTVNLPADGRYAWSVVASDGNSNSASTPPRALLLDRAAPWAQMQVAQTKAVSSTQLPPQTIALQTINGDLRGTEVLTDPTLQRLVITDPGAYSQLPPLTTTGNLPAIRLSWWATDTLSGLTLFDVQARELVRATTNYTIAVVEQEITKIVYQLELSGTEEITQALVVTELVPFTTVVPIVSQQIISPSEWVTVATGLRLTETLFIGNPGSTYEFRVRAVDGAGNQQDWYEGYSIQAEIDPKTVLFRVYAPVVANQ
jgi:hypothetical protein